MSVFAYLHMFKISYAQSRKIMTVDIEEFFTIDKILNKTQL